MLDNPDHLSGAARAGTLLYELAFPYAGSSMPLVGQETGAEIPIFIYLIYILKSFCWTFLPIYLKKKQ